MEDYRLPYVPKPLTAERIAELNNRSDLAIDATGSVGCGLHSRFGARWLSKTEAEGQACQNFQCVAKREQAARIAQRQALEAQGIPTCWFCGKTGHYSCD